MRPLAMIAVVALAVYYFLRVFFFLAADYSFWDRFFAVLLLIAETYMIIHAVGYVAAVFRLGSGFKESLSEKLDPLKLPRVAVALAVRNEPIKIVEQSIITINNLNYAHKDIFLLDGSDDGAFIKANRDLCRNYGIHYFHPEHPHGAKAGTLNDFIDKRLDQKYLVVLDADSNPMPDFLNKVVSIAETDDKIAFVQTPQFYSNPTVSPIARGASMQQAVFYEAICESKGMINAMFCCGTNVLFRRRALVSVGGFDEDSITEDFSTSLKFHLKGYRSVYYNHVRVFNMAPETLPGYFKQQARWAAGTTGVLKKVLASFVQGPGRLSTGQWVEYFLSGSYYFVGWSFLLLMLCPIVFLIFNVPSYFMSPYVYIPAFLPYFAMTLTVFYGTMKKRHYSLREIYYGNILGSVAFPVLMVATIKGLLGRRLKFLVTPKGQGGQLETIELWPWILMITLNFVGIVFGFLRIQENVLAFSINIFWCSYHIFILSQIFLLNQPPKFKKQDY